MKFEAQFQLVTWS